MLNSGQVSHVFPCRSRQAAAVRELDADQKSRALSLMLETRKTQGHKSCFFWKRSGFKQWHLTIMWLAPLINYLEWKHWVPHQREWRVCCSSTPDCELSNRETILNSYLYFLDKCNLQMKQCSHEPKWPNFPKIALKVKFPFKAQCQKRNFVKQIISVDKTSQRMLQ